MSSVEGAINNNKYEVLETSASSTRTSELVPPDTKGAAPTTIVKVKMIDNQQIEVPISEGSDIRASALRDKVS